MVGRSDKGQMMLMRTFLAASVMVGATAVPSFAADVAGDAFSQCDCIVPVSAPAQGFGQITLSNGEVLVLGDGGYRPAQVNQSVTPATQLLSGPTGSAELQFANGCSVAVDGSQSLLISQPAGPSGDFCVRVSSTVPAGFANAGASAGASGPNMTAIGAVIAGAGVLGIGVYALTASR